jgi:hypothetical protein
MSGIRSPISDSAVGQVGGHAGSSFSVIFAIDVAWSATRSMSALTFRQNARARKSCPYGLLERQQLAGTPARSATSSSSTRIVAPADVG